MKHTDKRAEAEAFIDKVIAPTKKTDTARQKHFESRAVFQKDELKRARETLQASGVDVDRLDQFAKERSAARKKFADDERRLGFDDSSLDGRYLNPGNFVFPADPNDTVIDEVTFIRSFADQGTVFDSNIAPGDNWARYQVKNNGYEGTGRLSFFTLWQNPLSTNVLVTPRVNFSVSAKLSASVEGSGIGDWFGISSTTKGTVHVRTTVWGMSAQERTIVDDRKLGDVSVTSGWFGDDTSQSIDFDSILQGAGALVAPNAYMLFETEVLTDWDLISGSVQFDAQDGSRRVALTRLTLSGVGTQPPASIVLSVTISQIAGGAIANLSWSGANGSQVDIYDNGVRMGTVANSGMFGLSVTSGNHLFRVCEAGGTRCSNDVTVTVP